MNPDRPSVRLSSRPTLSSQEGRHSACCFEDVAALGETLGGVARSLADVVMVVDHNGVLLYVNEACGPVLGLPAAQIRGRRLENRFKIRVVSL